jgi:lipid-binding SYLF domain-containing protein
LFCDFPDSLARFGSETHWTKVQYTNGTQVLHCVAVLKNMNITSTSKYTAGLLLAAVTLLTTRAVCADDLASDSRRALQQLVAQNPAAAKLKSKAVAVLVFSDVVKAGFVVGAQGGKGILFVHGQPRGRYRTVAASCGLQAGVQNYG